MTAQHLCYRPRVFFRLILYHCASVLAIKNSMSISKKLFHYSNKCTVHLLLFCNMTNKCTFISQIIIIYIYVNIYIYIYIYNSFIHLVVCLTTGPKSLPKQALHTVGSRASHFKWQYPLLSLWSSSSFLRLFPRLLLTSIPHFTFHSITCCRRQSPRKMWPIQLAFHLLISCRIFLYSLTLSNKSSFLTWSVQLIFSILLQRHISKLSRCFWSTARSVQVSTQYKAMLQIINIIMRFQRV